MNHQKQTSILFLFGKDIGKIIDEIQTGVRPVAHCYWLLKMQDEHPDIHYLGGKLRRSWFGFIWGLIRRLVYKYSEIGFNIEVALANRKSINNANVVFCTTDSIALPVLALKKLGMIRSKIVYQTIGLWDAWNRRKNGLMRRRGSWVIAQA